MIICFYSFMKDYYTYDHYEKIEPVLNLVTLLMTCMYDIYCFNNGWGKRSRRNDEYFSMTFYKFVVTSQFTYY